MASPDKEKVNPSIVLSGCCLWTELLILLYLLPHHAAAVLFVSQRLWGDYNEASHPVLHSDSSARALAVL